MIDKHLIEKKLRKIEEFLNELSNARIESIDDLRKEVVIKRFIERNLELSIEQMVDVCKHLISGLDLEEPETYTECFDILQKNNVIPKKDADVFKSMARFRNILIHLYDTVDDSITYDIYKNRLDDFRRFVIVLRNYLKEHN